MSSNQKNRLHMNVYRPFFPSNEMKSFSYVIFMVFVYGFFFFMVAIRNDGKCNYYKNHPIRMSRQPFFDRDNIDWAHFFQFNSSKMMQTLCTIYIIFRLLSVQMNLFVFDLSVIAIEIRSIYKMVIDSLWAANSKIATDKLIGRNLIKWQRVKWEQNEENL